jgi:hypothetical protein
MSARRKPAAWVESWTLPGQFFSRRDVASLGEVGQSSVLLEAFVSRVNRRHAIRTVRFWGST